MISRLCELAFRGQGRQRFTQPRSHKFARPFEKARNHHIYPQLTVTPSNDVLSRASMRSFSHVEFLYEIFHLSVLLPLSNLDRSLCRLFLLVIEVKERLPSGPHFMIDVLHGRGQRPNSVVGVPVKAGVRGRVFPVLELIFTRSLDWGFKDK